MSNLELPSLQVLIAFAESKNIVEAARRLRISQPAVTQRLQRLEQGVPQPLFAFEGRKKVLTHYGRAYYETAKENLSRLERDFETLNRRYASASELVLRVGCRKELFDLFSRVVRFGGRVDYSHLPDPQALEELQQDRIDVAITEAPAHAPELVARKIGEGSSRFVFHPKVFGARAPRSFRDLQKAKSLLTRAPAVFHKTETRFQDGLAEALSLAPERLNCRALLEGWSAVLAQVEKGTGYSVVPAFVELRSDDLVTFDVPHAVIPYTTYYAVFARKLLAVRAFQEALKFSVSSS